VSVETVLDEIAKLEELRALGLSEALFRDVLGKLVTHYWQRAASEKPHELRRHSPRIATPCWPRCAGNGSEKSAAFVFNRPTVVRPTTVRSSIRTPLRSKCKSLVLPRMKQPELSGSIPLRFGPLCA
jgi:hypothetical protein